MDVNAVGILIGAIGGVLASILGVILTKGKLAEVIVGKVRREQTAVDTMAALLENAIAGWLAMSKSIQELSAQEVRRSNEVHRHRETAMSGVSSLEICINELVDTVDEVAEQQRELMMILKQQEAK